MRAADPVDELLTVLHCRLPGRSQLRADMLREIRVEIEGARDSYLDAGLDPLDAARRAVAEFGDVTPAVTDLRVEIAARAARRTALLVGAGYPLMLVLWTINGAVSPAMSGTSAPSWVTGSFALVSHLMFGAGSLLVVALMWSARNRRGLVALIRVQVSVIGIAAMTTFLAVILQLMMSDLHGPPNPYQWVNDVAEYFSGVFVTATLLAGMLMLRQGRQLLPGR